MLLPADEQIIRRDPALPGLAALLDEDRFTARLRALAPDAGIVAAELRYLRYKQGTSCVAGYDVIAGQGTVPVYARAAHEGDADVKLDKAEQRRSVASTLGFGITVCRDDAIAVYPFPNDHHLKRLPTVTDPVERRPLLQRMLGEHPHLHDARLITVRYKPERRYVGRLEGDDGAAASLKLYTERRFDAVSRCQGHFRSDGEVHVPAVLGRSSGELVFALEWIDGRPLLESLDDDDAAESGCRRAGAALAALHGQRSGRLPDLTCDEFLSQVRASCEAVATVQPELGDPLERTLARLADRLPRRPWRTHALHGDFSADQVLLSDDHVAVIDFDRAGRGDPRVDLGTFAAKLDYAAAGGTIPGHRAEACRDALLEAYRLASPRDLTGHLWLFTGACLLRLAPEPFRHRLPDWPAVTAAVVERAEECVRGAVRH
jgi:aminoglycoside phosphotransferase (APT) family kinase protein